MSFIAILKSFSRHSRYGRGPFHEGRVTKDAIGSLFTLALGIYITTLSADHRITAAFLQVRSIVDSVNSVGGTVNQGKTLVRYCQALWKAEKKTHCTLALGFSS